MPRRVEPLLDLIGLVGVATGGTMVTLAIALAAASLDSAPLSLPVVETLSAWLSAPQIGGLAQLALAGVVVAAIGALLASWSRSLSANLQSRLAGRTQEPVPFEFGGHGRTEATESRRRGSNPAVSRRGSIGSGGHTAVDWISELFDRPPRTTALAPRADSSRSPEQLANAEKTGIAAESPPSDVEAASVTREAVRRIIDRLRDEIGAARARHRTVAAGLADPSGTDVQETIDDLRETVRADPSLDEHVEAIRSSLRHVESAAERLRAGA